jgi:small-conductance mechanosensitive channel
MIIAGIILEIDAMIISISVTAILVSLVVLVGFSSTLSRFLEGVLFVLIRKPYDIGDAVEIQSFTMPGATTCLLYPYGCWIVENVNLSSTTLRNDSTREVATIANGTMFQARIITRTRLEYSSVCMRFPFPVLSNNKQVERFREKLSDFLHARPREWVCLSSFVCNCQVEAGFMEYILIVIHREPWRNEKVIMESKGRLLCYCLQVQKDLAIIRQTTAPH